MYVANYFLQGEVTHAGLPQWLAEQIGLHGNSPDAVQLVIYINSGGGDVLAAVESINLIRSSPIPVTTIINGCAESAALMIAVTGHRRLIFSSSWGMAHHFSTGLEGTYHDLMDSIKHNQLLHDLLVDIYKQYSNLSVADVEKRILGRQNTWLTAKELVDLGMMDEILSPGASVVRKITHYEGNKTKKTKTTKATK